MEGNQKNTASDAASMARSAVKAVRVAQKAAKIAAGAGAGGVGAFVVAAWENKDVLIKLLAVSLILSIMLAGYAASIPMVIFNWATGNADTSNGAQKTIASYQTMVTAMQKGLASRVNEMLEEYNSDAQKNHYVSQDSAEAKEMVTPELRAALHVDIHNLIGNNAAAMSAIDHDTSQDSLTPDIIAAYTNAVTATAQQEQAAAAAQARNSYEAQMTAKAQSENQQQYDQQLQITGQADQSILTQNLNRYIDPNTENQLADTAGTAAYNAAIAAADIPGRSSDITRFVQTDILAHPPRTIYKIADGGSGQGIDDNSTALAIACYSISEGNDQNASASEFEQKISAGAFEYFTENTTSSTNASTHQATVTYSIGFVSDGAKKLFGLDDQKYQEAVNMAMNLLTTIQHLSGNTAAGNIVDIYDSSPGSGAPGSPLTNHPGNVPGLPISNNLIAFIEDWEGCDHTPVRGLDSQNLTVGYGHVELPGENFTYLTDEQAQDLLIQDMSNPTYGYITSVEKTFASANLTQSQFDSLVDLAYGFGPGIFKRANLTQAVLSHADPQTIKADFESLDTCNGQFVQELFDRRDADWVMFEQGIYEQQYSGNVSNPGTSSSSVVNYAQQYIGYPYILGTAGPDTFDCSGLVQWVYAHVSGISLPHSAAEQSTMGTAVNLSDIQPGDCVFFNVDGSGVDHVGIYIGNGEMVNAENPHAGVKDDSIFSSYWQPKIVCVRRF